MGSPIEARSKDHISDLAYGNEIVHVCPVDRIVFEIGILNDQNLSRGGSKSSLECTTLTAILLMVDRTDSDNSRF